MVTQVIIHRTSLSPSSSESCGINLKSEILSSFSSVPFWCESQTITTLFMDSMEKILSTADGDVESCLVTPCTFPRLPSMRGSSEGQFRSSDASWRVLLRVNQSIEAVYSAKKWLT